MVEHLWVQNDIECREHVSIIPPGNRCKLVVPGGALTAALSFLTGPIPENHSSHVNIKYTFSHLLHAGDLGSRVSLPTASWSLGDRAVLPPAGLKSLTDEGSRQPP